MTLIIYSFKGIFIVFYKVNIITNAKLQYNIYSLSCQKYMSEYCKE